jgi:hypothetical protein
VALEYKREDGSEGEENGSEMQISAKMAKTDWTLENGQSFW